MKTPRKKFLFGGLAALVVLLCVWYARPVGVETLFPGLQPDLIDVTLIDFTGSGHEDRNLRLTAGTPEFDDLWADIQALQFHRSPLNVIVQTFPFLENPGGPKLLEDGEIDTLLIGLAQDNGKPVWRMEELSFRVDEWRYQDSKHGVSLPLIMSNGKTVGQTMAHVLWEQAEE